MTGLYDMLRAELARDGSRPFLTFYDDATGERVELSVATFDNWVAKSAGLLRDGLSAAPGDRVALLLPAHWQALVWACACWAAGTTAVLAPLGEMSAGDGTVPAAAPAAGVEPLAPGGAALVSVGDADVAVTGPDTLDAASAAPDVVVLSLRPLGGRFTGALPPGALDYADEVPAYPDELRPYVPPEPGSPAIEHGGAVRSHAEVADDARDRARRLGLDEGSRVLVPTDDLDGAVRDALAVPLVLGGSAVLVRHEDPERREGRATAERATAAPH